MFRLMRYLGSRARTTPGDKPPPSETNPTSVLELCHQGEAHLASGDIQRAIESYRQAILLSSTDADASVRLAQLLAKQRQFSEAHAVLVAPGSIGGSNWLHLLELGKAAEEEGDKDEAIACYRTVLQLTPPYTDIHPWPECHWRLASLLFGLGRLQEALAVMEEFVAINTSSPDAYGLIGTILSQLGRSAEAAEMFEKVLQMTDRRHALAADYAAATSMALRRWKEAGEYAKLASTLNPSYQNKFRNAYLTLLSGNFETGWKEFEEVLPLIGDPNNPEGAQYLRNALGTEKYWRGQCLDGKTLTVWMEHGLGDAIMMARFIPLIRKRFGKARLVILAFPQLTRLFSQLDVDQVLPIPDRREIQRITSDYHCSIMSLPYVFRLGALSDIPNCAPYLEIPASESKSWADRLMPFSGVKAGLVWSGNPKNVEGRARSMHFGSLSRLFGVEGVTWFSLQKGTAAEELSTLRYPIIDWMGDCKDLLDTAALVANLDLVVSVDTSVAHLAGALGKPVWLMNRYESDWRWMVDRQDSPWYPTMRIFNQKHPMDWHSTVAEVAAALDAVAESP